jgi:hypothetical protein
MKNQGKIRSTITYMARYVTDITDEEIYFLLYQETILLISLYK